MNGKEKETQQKQTYVDTLDPISKARYFDKMRLVDNRDPYEIPNREWSTNVELWPDIQYPDIVNYLVYTQSAYTLKDMKAYKSLESYNQFVSGWVKEVGQITVGNKCLMSARVRHSQRMNDTPLHCWLVAEKEGTVLAAHCNCMAGLAESCSHVGAMLFAIEAAVKLKKSQTVTQEKSYWLPAVIQKVEGKPVQEIDFTSAKTKKKLFDASLSPATQITPKGRRSVPAAVIPPPSEAELQDFFQGLHKSEMKPVILSLVPGYAEQYIPKAMDKKFPKVFSELRDENYITVNREALLQHCQEVFESLKITDEDVKNVEIATRQQANCREWHRFRTGRITASRMKAVCHTSIEKPSQSLIKQICYPATVKFSTEATKWGCDHEKEARDKYVDSMKLNHENFEMTDNGLILNTSYPYLGASPDGLASCDCCGDVCIEIKCPFCKKDSQLDDSLDCLETFEGKLRLKRTHAYYYQVQCHLLVCEKEFCDFIVWTSCDFYSERIAVDPDFCTTILQKSKSFFVSALLPELVGKLFSRPTYSSNVLGPISDQLLGTNSNSANSALNDEDESLIICTCQTIYDSKNDDVIGCDNDECPYVWFHFQCVNIKHVPKGKWYCQLCRKQSKIKRNNKNKEN